MKVTFEYVNNLLFFYRASFLHSYAERDRARYWYSNFVRLSVCPSVCHVLILSQNDWIDH